MDLTGISVGMCKSDALSLTSDAQPFQVGDGRHHFENIQTQRMMKDGEGRLDGLCSVILHCACGPGIHKSS